MPGKGMWKPDTNSRSVATRSRMRLRVATALSLSSSTSTCHAGRWMNGCISPCVDAGTPTSRNFRLCVFLALDPRPAVREQALLWQEAAFVIHLARIPHPVAQIGVGQAHLARARDVI